MNTSQIIVEIDKEISHLQHIRSLLAGGTTAPAPSAARRGRPRKDANAGSPTPAVAKKGRRRRGGMSPEGRRRIAEAQRKRWAAMKAASGK